MLRKSAAFTLGLGWVKYLLQIGIASILMLVALMQVLPLSTQWLEWSGFMRVAALLGFMLLGAVLYIGALAILGLRKKDFALQQV
jgi:putative peptidoglycan lipid II flippase